MEEERLEQIAEEYDISISRVKSYYEILKKYPVVESYNEELLFECLEEVVQDMSTNEFIIEDTDKFTHEDKIKPLKYSISDALYRTYGDDAVPYLDETYIKENSHRHGL